MILISTFIAALFALSASPPAQLPEYQVVFDDFEYRNARQMFGRNAWQTRTGRMATSRMWYRFNWRDCEIDSKAGLSANGESVRLEAAPGHKRV